MKKMKLRSCVMRAAYLAQDDSLVCLGGEVVGKTSVVTEWSRPVAVEADWKASREVFHDGE